MLLKESAYRLPAALLVLMAAFAVTFQTIEVAAEEEETYSFLSLSTDVNGTYLTISGEIEGDGPSSLTVDFEDAVTGSVSVGNDGLFSFTTQNFSTGDALAVLMDGSVELAVEPFDVAQ